MDWKRTLVIGQDGVRRAQYRGSNPHNADMGPACAYGSRATLPADALARSVILANDCADYLEVVGWKRGADRAAYLRNAAEYYCGSMGVADPAIEREVYRYMRRHVAAYIARLREIARQRRAANKESVA